MWLTFAQYRYIILGIKGAFMKNEISIDQYAKLLQSVGIDTTGFDEQIIKHFGSYLADSLPAPSLKLILRYNWKWLFNFHSISSSQYGVKKEWQIIKIQGPSGSLRVEGYVNDDFRWKLCA